MSFFNKIKKTLTRDLPENFCVAPFVQMDLHEQGRVNACCKAKDELGDWSKKSISEIWNDRPLRHLRRQFLDGRRPRGCSTCWRQEEKGLSSRRQNYNETLASELESLRRQYRKDRAALEERPLRFSSLDVGFGAQCSLRCRMCGPSSSSKWLSTALKKPEVYKYFTDLGELNPQIADTGFKDFLTEPLFEDFAKNIVPNVDDLMISGGEPLNSRNHYRLFAEKLSSEQLRQMKVTLTTNAQTTEFGGKSLIPYWQELKRFIYRISIDGTGSAYPYVRSGGSFDKVIDSAKKVREAFPYESGQLLMVATVAVSLYNITRLGELIDFAVENGLLLYLNWVHFPEFLAIANLPEELKEKCLSDIEAKKIELQKESYWQSHPLWEKPLEFDYSYQVFRQFLEQNQSVTQTPLTYRDYAKARCLQQIDEVMAHLKSVDGQMKKRKELIHHIQLLDRLNETQFLRTFPEYKAFIERD